MKLKNLKEEEESIIDLLIDDVNEACSSDERSIAIANLINFINLVKG